MTQERQKMPDDIYTSYWQAFENHLKNNDSKLSMMLNTAKKDYGRTFFHVAKGLDIVATITLGKEGEARGCVEVLLEYIGDEDYKNGEDDYNRDAFHELEKDEKAIENSLGDDLKLVWMERGEFPRSKKPRARISCFKDFNSNEAADWHEHYPWFIETIEKFDDVFTHRLKKIELLR